ncbi:hypothetical protein KUTeg_010765 [Tegillarca granosa]|uniref:Dymeclin n=1 Tax=Tegillarca granosa TaxID=220873 RepID=A0ABQ9F595_TEGGR|nr:hypothetical protein KUTeg_010765 [Tegillarca granosa]
MVFNVPVKKERERERERDYLDIYVIEVFTGFLDVSILRQKDPGCKCSICGTLPLTITMGAHSSSISELSSNDADAKLLEESTSGLCKNFAIHNCKSGNFGALVRNFLVRATELKASAQCEDNIFTWQTYNALFIVRSYVDASEVGPLGEELMNSLVELLVDVPVVQIHACLLVKSLLRNFANQQKCPPELLWSVMTLGMGGKEEKKEEEYNETLLANQSLLFLLVMPILKILYNAQDRNSHHIYMALIILLILSEDDVFNKSIHECVIKNIPWFKERTITEITLGGLLILVVIRTIQYNMTRMRDKYLHTNCLAALANMSSHFSNLHPYVAQRLVSLFSQLFKKHTKLIEQIREAAINEGEQKPEDSDHESEQDYEVIRMVLEIINSCVTNSLHHNPNLIYTLLYRKELFGQFRTHPTFQDIIQNIDTVLSFFSARLEKDSTNLSPNEVLEIIKEGAVHFRRDKLKKFPDLKFKYVEEESPEEFFIPYIWSLVYHSSNMYFNASRIILFSLASS